MLPQISGVSLSVSVLLLILASCGDPSYQVRQSQRYGEMPPGEA